VSTSKLPVRPSLESLRKQAKKLARDIVARNAGTIARARAQLPKAELPLSQRDAQLVLAREYGFPGWKDRRFSPVNYRVDPFIRVPRQTERPTRANWAHGVQL
jgi:hypothetical protein